MAEGGVSSLVGGKLKCSICLEDFEKPKLLPCFHTFCFSCLDRFVKTNSRRGMFECPLCRTNITLPENGIQGFQSNFYIDQGEGTGSGFAVLCNMCDDGKASASHKCIDCEENLCGTCAKHHMRMKLTREHKMMNIADVSPATRRKIQHRVFCKEHENDEVRFVCRKCDKVLCIACKLTKHENHETEDISTSANEMREKLAELLRSQSITTYVTRLNENATERSRTKKELENLLAVDFTAVDDQVRKLHKEIDELSTVQKKRLNETYSRDIAIVKDQIKEFESKHGSVGSLTKTIRQILDQDGDVDILEKGQGLLETLKNIGTDDTTIGKYNVTTRFVTGTIRRDALNAMVGEVMDTVISPAVPAKQVKELKPENLELISSIKVPGSWKSGYVAGIVPIRNNRAWINMWNEDTKVHLIDIKGNILENVDIGDKCHHITAKDDSGFVVSCIHSKCIKEVTRDREVKLLLSSLSLRPHGLAYRRTSTGRQELLYTSSNNEYSREGETRVSRTRGDLGQVICSENKQPVRISCDANSEQICVGSCFEHLVTIHDSSGKLVSQYSDNSLFYPRDVCFYDSECIVIPNDRGDVRKIRADGSGMQKLLSDKSKSYWSLAFDDNEQMWVGLSGGCVEVYRIK